MSTVFEKTWQADVNRAPGDNTSVIGLSRSFVWYVKAYLLGQQGGAASGLWSTYYSCDSSTAGTANDGVDRWGSTFNGANIIRATAGSAHSWYVLKSPTFSTPAGNMNFYMIMDFSGTSDSNALNLTFSKAAPTGGSITARPTSTDEWSHQANSQLNDGSIGAMLFHGHLSTDGNFIFAGSKTGSGLAAVGTFFHVLSETRTTDLYPAVSYFDYNATSLGSTNRGAFNASGSNLDLLVNSNWRMRLFDGSAVSVGTVAVQPSIQGGTLIAGASWQTAGTDFSDGFIGDLPIYVFNNDGSKASLRGRLADMRYAVGNPAQAVTEPPGGPPTSGILGSIWIPTNAGWTL